MLSIDNYAGQDGSSQSFNRYSYVLNNPLMYTDPDGENPTGNLQCDFCTPLPIDAGGGLGSAGVSLFAHFAANFISFNPDNSFIVSGTGNSVGNNSLTDPIRIIRQLIENYTKDQADDIITEMTDQESATSRLLLDPPSKRSAIDFKVCIYTCEINVEDFKIYPGNNTLDFVKLFMKSENTGYGLTIGPFFRIYGPPSQEFTSMGGRKVRTGSGYGNNVRGHFTIKKDIKLLESLINDKIKTIITGYIDNNYTTQTRITAVNWLNSKYSYLNIK